MTETEAIQKAVASRMEKLDESFLVALGAYISAAEEQGDKALAGKIPATSNTDPACTLNSLLHILCL